VSEERVKYERPVILDFGSITDNTFGGTGNNGRSTSPKSASGVFLDTFHDFDSPS
jgi:hypothetical protein